MSNIQVCGKCGFDLPSSRYDSADQARESTPCSCVLEPRTRAQAVRESEKGMSAAPSRTSELLVRLEAREQERKAIVGTVPEVPFLTELQGIAIARGDTSLLYIWAHPEYQALVKNLSSVQARCTAQENELRALRSKWALEYAKEVGVKPLEAPTLEVMTTAHPGEHLAASMQGKPPRVSKSKYAVGSVAWLNERDGK